MTQQSPNLVVGAFIFNKEGKIFLVRSNRWNNKFVVPGGHIQLGEQMKQTLKRKIKQEIGLDIYDSEFLCVKESIFEDTFWKKKHFIFLNFACKTDLDKPTLNKDEKFDEFVWVTPQEALKLDIESHTANTIKEHLIK